MGFLLQVDSLKTEKDSMPTEALPKRTVYTDPFPWEFFLGTIVS